MPPIPETEITKLTSFERDAATEAIVAPWLSPWTPTFEPRTSARPFRHLTPAIASSARS